jgi:hypothetical protein
MPVIGRLDGQVEDVLIAPLSKTRPAPEKVPPAAQTSDAPTQPTGTPAAPHNQTSRERAELPVWLL